MSEIFDTENIHAKWLMLACLICVVDRALQPISEQGENTKDDTIKGDESDRNSAGVGSNEKDLERGCESIDLYNKDKVDCAYNTKDENSLQNNQESLASKEDYSACNKLIEKFQEAVLDNAVRIIQAAFKRFRERRHFLKLKKAATVIQRSVRQWLKLRQSNERPRLKSLKHKGKLEIGEQKSGSMPNLLNGKVDGIHTENKEKGGERETPHGEFEDEREPTNGGFEDERDNCQCNCKELIHGNEELCARESTVDETDQFDISFDSLDTESFMGSADNLSETDVCLDQNGDNSPTGDADALSLADSGIDMCSDTVQEVAIIEECEFSKIENTLPNTSSSLTNEPTDHQKWEEFGPRWHNNF